MKKYVLLDKIRSMYNVGSFFRTCDGAGISKLILTGYTATPPRKEISKTALHADEHIPWQHYENAMDAVLELKKEGFIIVSVEKNNISKDFRETDLHTYEKICFIFGNEVEGVASGILEISDHIIHLPMLGIKESLNVAVSGGAILYHYL
ncbi:MAG: TrmH family RNA methyltransferase [Candidatus Gracilibacteria bacterium]